MSLVVWLGSTQLVKIVLLLVLRLTVGTTPAKLYSYDESHIPFTTTMKAGFKRRGEAKNEEVSDTVLTMEGSRGKKLKSFYHEKIENENDRDILLRKLEKVSGSIQPGSPMSPMNSHNVTSQNDKYFTVDILVATFLDENATDNMKQNMKRAHVTAADVLSGAKEGVRLLDAVVTTLTQLLEEEVRSKIVGEANFQLRRLLAERSITLEHNMEHAGFEVLDEGNWVYMKIPFEVSESFLPNEESLDSSTGGMATGRSSTASYGEPTGDGSQEEGQPPVSTREVFLHVLKFLNRAAKDGSLLEALQLANKNIEAVRIRSTGLFDNAKPTVYHSTRLVGIILLAVSSTLVMSLIIEASRKKRAVSQREERKLLVSKLVRERRSIHTQKQSQGAQKKPGTSTRTDIAQRNKGSQYLVENQHRGQHLGHNNRSKDKEQQSSNICEENEVMVLETVKEEEDERKSSSPRWTQWSNPEDSEGILQDLEEKSLEGTVVQFRDLSLRSMT